MLFHLQKNLASAAVFLFTKKIQQLVRKRTMSNSTFSMTSMTTEQRKAALRLYNLHHRHLDRLKVNARGISDMERSKMREFVKQHQEGQKMTLTDLREQLLIEYMERLRTVVRAEKFWRIGEPELLNCRFDMLMQLCEEEKLQELRTMQFEVEREWNRQKNLKKEEGRRERQKHAEMQHRIACRKLEVCELRDPTVSGLNRNSNLPSTSCEKKRTASPYRGTVLKTTITPPGNTTLKPTIPSSRNTTQKTTIPSYMDAVQIRTMTPSRNTTQKPPITPTRTTTQKPPITPTRTTTQNPPITPTRTTTQKPPITPTRTTTQKPPITPTKTTTQKPPITPTRTTAQKPPITPTKTTAQKPPITPTKTTAQKPPITPTRTTAQKPPITPTKTTAQKPPITPTRTTTEKPPITPTRNGASSSPLSGVLQVSAKPLVAPAAAQRKPDAKNAMKQRPMKS